MNTIWMLVIVFLLVIVDWLTFHDIFEPHSLRDWLTLSASMLFFLYFAKEVSKKLSGFIKGKSEEGGKQV